MLKAGVRGETAGGGVLPLNYVLGGCPVRVWAGSRLPFKGLGNTLERTLPVCAHCPLMTRAGVSDQEARSSGGPGWAEARAARGQPAVRVRACLGSGLPTTKLSATAFQGSKKKEECMCVGRGWGRTDREGVVFMPLASFA